MPVISSLKSAHLHTAMIGKQAIKLSSFIKVYISKELYGFFRKISSRHLLKKLDEKIPCYIGHNHALTEISGYLGH